MIDKNILERYLEYEPFDTAPLVNQPKVNYSEPYGADNSSDLEIAINDNPENTRIESGKSLIEDTSHNLINGRILRLGDFIDTDAVGLHS